MAMASTSGVLDVMEATRPELRNVHENVAFAIHAAFLDAGYVLVSAGPNLMMKMFPRLDALFNLGAQDVGLEGWNAGDGVFTFLYTGGDRPDLPRSILVRMVTVEDMLMVDAALVGEGDEVEVAQGLVHLAIKPSDFANEMDVTKYVDLFRDLDGLVKLANENLICSLSKSQEPCAEAGEAGETAGGIWAQRMSREPAGSEFPATYVPPIPGTVASDLFPEAGVGIFSRRRLRSLNGGMIAGLGDQRFEAPPGARFDAV